MPLFAPVTMAHLPSCAGTSCALQFFFMTVLLAAVIQS
jgi:hypothetical protein